MRLLGKSPGFALIAISALAIGVGANVTVFGFAASLLLSDIPGTHEPDRLIRGYSDGLNPVSLLPYDDYRQYRDRNRTLESLALFHWGGLHPVAVDGPPIAIHAMPVSGNYFRTLGVQAAIGRPITEEDDQPGAPPVVLLSDACWRTHFASNPRILGKSIVVDRVPRTIIGVLPSEFHGATGAPLIPQLYLPWTGRDGRPSGSGQLIGRLLPGVSRGQAQADLSRIAGQLTDEHGDKNRVSIYVFPAKMLAPMMIRNTWLIAALLLTVVAVALLIACDNVAILLLARAVARRREIAVRLALGASRGQLAGQLLAESLPLALLGGVGATAVAFGTARWLMQVSLPVPMPIGLVFDVDWHVLAFTAAISLATTLAFGLAPALYGLRTDVVSSLKAGALSPDRSALRFGLVATQVALCASMLMVSSVFARTLAAPAVMDHGFASDHVLMCTLVLPADSYGREKGTAFYSRLLDRVTNLAGVSGASLADSVPLTGNVALASVEMFTEHGDRVDGHSAGVYTNRISPSYFHTLSIPFVDGRDFTVRDDGQAPAVGIVNETLARQLWPLENPIGKRLRPANGSWVEVVGLVRDSKYFGPEDSAKAFLYRPVAQEYLPSATLLIKTASKPTLQAGPVRTLVAEMDPDLAAYNLNTLDDRIGLTLFPNRVAALTAGILGLLALVLGAVGTYGVMSLLVQERRVEVGLRLALGATPAQVRGMITYQGMKWTAIGLGAGIVAGQGLTRLMRGLLYGVSPSDPVATASVVALLVISAYAACYFPSRQASRLQPLDALRNE